VVRLHKGGMPNKALYPTPKPRSDLGSLRAARSGEGELDRYALQAET